MTERLLQTYVARQAQTRPDALAVVTASQTVTYGQLERRTNQLARLLRDSGVRRGDRIGVLMPKSPESILSFLGILKAECVYVPMAPASPAARLEKIVQSCGARWLLCGGNAAALDELVERNPLSIGWIDSQPRAKQITVAFARQDILAGDDRPLDYQNTPSDAAHILFTSGSTGTPKGVVITHSNVSQFVEWGVRYFGISAGDRNSGHSPLQFDLSTFDIYGTLAAGAQLHLVPPELNLSPHRLADFIRSGELTQWFSAPAILHHMAKSDVVRPNDFPSLKRLLWCGEVFPTPSLMYWMQRLPHVTFTNLYGPTEATIASSYYTVRQCPADEKQQIPIGTACEGESLHVLDEELRPVPVGETGWLYIEGVGLSPGYWQDEEKTRAVFLTSPHLPDPNARIYKTGDLARIGPEGLIYYLGRADTQIKCRGYRIELGEIETALNAITGLKESAVVAVDTDGLEGKAICCAYVPADSQPITPAFLRRELTKVLPPYMIPARWAEYPQLPKNSNGKIDRPTLRQGFTAPQPAGADADRAPRRAEAPLSA